MSRSPQGLDGCIGDRWNTVGARVIERVGVLTASCVWEQVDVPVEDRLWLRVEDLVTNPVRVEGDR